MAKLKAPLMSLGASGALGKAIVFFPWKGLDVAREYVVPTNPKSTDQDTQRGYLTAVVAAIHTAQARATFPLSEIDTIAYALYGSTYPTPRTWFNQIVKGWLDQRVAGLRSVIFRAATVVPGSTQIYIDIRWTPDGANNITAGHFWYGKSKTALINSKVPDLFSDNTAEVTITGLTAGTKYYIQFRPTAHADFVGVRSGIYIGTPLA